MEKYNPQRKVGCCPNPAHDDHNPSCSYNPKNYTMHCFSCGFSVDILGAYMMESNCTFIDACERLFAEADIHYDFTEHRVRKNKQYYYPVPQYSEDKSIVYGYWAKRGISEKTIDYLDIQQDARDGNTLFQYYDLNDVLVTVKSRKSRLVSKDEKNERGERVSKIRHLCDDNGKSFDHMDILYNMNRINPTEPLVICSGEGDCAAAVEAGVYNTVSINGGDNNMKWIGECWDWLQQFQEIILVHDNDESGRKWVKDVSKRLGEYRIKVAEIPEIVMTDANGKPYQIEDKNGVKHDRTVNDLNELLVCAGPEVVRDVIEHAKDTEIPTIVDYTDVKRFDMSEVDGFVTRLDALDTSLQKFYMGSTTILTGSPGSGKTSFLSTLICQSVDQGFPVFVYSGELSNPSLKSWVDFCHAGRYGLKEYFHANNHTPYYKVDPSAFDAINEHYKGQILFYKDNLAQKVSDIMATAESVVRKCGVKTLVFDNMSSVDLECGADDKWQKQEDFIRNIISFSTRWDVCCLVVLHPKKISESRITSLYQLSGVVAAANLSHRVLSLYRVSQKDKQGSKKANGTWYKEPVDHDVLIDVLKDRFGSGAGQTVGLFYDKPSKRFYDENYQETLFYQYGWDTRNHNGETYPGEIPTPERIRDEENREIFGAPLPQ